MSSTRLSSPRDQGDQWVLPRARGSRDSAQQIERILLTALVAWTFVAWLGSGGNPLPLVLLVLAVGAAITVGRWAGAVDRTLVPIVIAAIAGSFLLISPVSTFSSAAGRGAFGYANAKAAFFVVAAVAAVTLAFRMRSSRGRALALVVATVFSVVPLTSRAAAASLLIAALFVTTVAVWRGVGSRLLVTIMGVGLVVIVTATVVLAATGPERVPDVGRSAFDVRRLALWHEATEIIRGHPVIGVGAGKFDEVSSTARSDPDNRWAHHEYLQIAAETGLPTSMLLLLFLLWEIRMGSPGSGTDGVRAMGAFAVLSVGIMASTDYILHFPLIPISVAALVGSATAMARDRSPDPVALLRRAVKLAALPVGLLQRRRGGDVVILLYHRVGAGVREIDLHSAAFRRQIEWLAGHDRVLSLEESLQGDNGGGLVVTFDDGYRDFHSNVLPVLVAHRVPAILYLATGLVVEDEHPDRMDWSQLREVVSTGLVTVGAHTHSHANLSSLPEPAIEEELRRSKSLIEDRLQVPCRDFAYPWAVGSSSADRLVRTYFASAALHAWRTNRAGRIDPHRLGRTPVLRSDGDSVLFRAKAAGMLDSESFAYRLLGRGPWERKRT